MPKPKVKKLFTGQQATRPIPVYHDSADDRAIDSASKQQKPKTITPAGKPTPYVQANPTAGSKVNGSPGGGTFSGSDSGNYV